MYIQNKFNNFAGEPDMIQVLENVEQKTALDLNCCRIGIVQSINEGGDIAEVLIANQKTIGLNPSGSQKTRNLAPVYAKICFCNPFETYPLKKGDEGLLLFSDREIESWYINGDVNPIAYQRMHSLTDAIFIAGLRSLPKMIEILKNAYHIFYGNSDIQLFENELNITSGNVNLNADTINLNGKIIINGQEYLQHTHENGNQGNPTGGVIES